MRERVTSKRGITAGMTHLEASRCGRASSKRYAPRVRAEEMGRQFDADEPRALPTNEYGTRADAGLSGSSGDRAREDRESSQLLWRKAANSSRVRPRIKPW
jgi:hypothetical protein